MTETAKDRALAEMATILALKGHLVGIEEIEAMYNAAVASTRSPSSVTAAAVSSKMQQIARAVDAAIEAAVGERQGFMVLVWAGGEVSYACTETDRSITFRAMEEILAKWRSGMPDTPAHKRH